MFAISTTDQIWFDFLKGSGLNSNVNFWTPTPWNPKKFHAGDRLYFMLKKPIRQIGGFGEFVQYKKLTASQAWNTFGFRNGRHSRQEFIDSIQEYIDKNSAELGGQPININTYEIGCIVLDNCEFWDDNLFMDPANHNIDFATQVVKLKYFNQDDPFNQAQNERDNFNLVNEPRNDRQGKTNIREGQSEFKGKILRAYNNCCCITSETIPELLEASHIQEYRNRNSNHVQNGLLLRVDLHRLYDNRLILIDRNFVIHVSDLVTSQLYREYHGKKITLPNAINDRPSGDALELRRNEFRN